jgi:hypothetical protein
MKLIVVCPYMEKLTRGRRTDLSRIAEKEMEARRSVNSASGSTAAAAINSCERNGWDYKVTMQGGRYFVERI